MESKITKQKHLAVEMERLLPDSSIAELVRIATRHGEWVYESLRTMTDPRGQGKAAVWAAKEVNQMNDLAKSVGQLAIFSSARSAKPSAAIATELRALAAALRRIEAHLKFRVEGPAPHAGPSEHLN